MNTKDILKKYWFVLVVIIFLIVFVVAYTMDSSKNGTTKVNTKQVDGNYVVYSIDGKNYTADELYEDLLDSYGVTSLYREFDRLVSDKAYKTTKEMENLATNNATYLLSQTGEDKSNLDSQLKQLGFNGVDDLTNYYIYLQKSQLLRADYLKAHEEELVKPYASKVHPKLISHILIKVDDIEKVTGEDKKVSYKANPTKEEKEKLDLVLAELENSSFADVAKKYSDDGSAQNGGYLGYFDDNNDTYVEVFKETAKTVTEGQRSEVITSEYGYHIIYCDSEKVADMYNETSFVQAIYGEDSILYNKSLLEKAEELDIKFVENDLSKKILEQIKPESEEK